MSDPYLRLESETFGAGIDLNTFSMTGSGVEAQPGVTGLGLPPINATFDPGAGDGATYIGRTIDSRTIELELAFSAEYRYTLRVWARQFLQLLTQEDLVLWWMDEDWENLYMKVHLISGGDYAYGIDTDGNTVLRTTVQLQSEDPFWRFDRDSSWNVTASTPNVPNRINFWNVGTADALVKVTVEGATNGYKYNLGGDTSKTIEYVGRTLVDHVAVYDHDKGTITGPGKVNLYGNLGTSPNFFTVPPGSQYIDFTYSDQTEGWSRYNLITNPLILGGAGPGWTYDTDWHQAAEFNTSDPAWRYTFGVEGYEVGDNIIQSFGTFLGQTVTDTANWKDGSAAKGHQPTLLMSGLTPGETYYFSFYYAGDYGDAAWQYSSIWTPGHVSIYDDPDEPPITKGILFDKTQTIQPGGLDPRYPGHMVTGGTGPQASTDTINRNILRRYELSFTPKGSSVTIKLWPAWARLGKSGSTYSYRILTTQFSHLYLGLDPNTYFDGSTPDETDPDWTMSYDWTGTPNRSTSINTFTLGASDKPRVTVELIERDWLVI